MFLTRLFNPSGIYQESIFNPKYFETTNVLATKLSDTSAVRRLKQLLLTCLLSTGQIVVFTRSSKLCFAWIVEKKSFIAFSDHFFKFILKVMENDENFLVLIKKCLKFYWCWFSLCHKTKPWRSISTSLIKNLSVF